MKRNLMRKIVGGISLTSALFVFQACYGTPQDLGMDCYFEGTVKSAKTGLPVPGIKVSVPVTGQYTLTDDQGAFSFYTELDKTIRVLCEDIDGQEHGVFLSKDTVVNPVSETVRLDISLEEQ